MLSSIKLQNLWRVISDIDLQRIRASARTPFELVVVADDPALAERVAAMLGDVGAGGRHPYVVAVDPEALRHRPVTPLVAVLASAAPELSLDLKAADEHCIRAGVPRVTLIVGTTSPDAAARRVAESVRVAVADLWPPPEPLLDAITDRIEGDARLAVAAALPIFRPVVAAAIVDETSKANASFAATTGLAETVPVLTAPLNVGDMVVLTKNQLIMGYKIALAAGRDGEPRAMITEILGVIGGGFMFRQMARQLVGLIPVAGLVPKVAIAYAGTYAIGRGLTAWALRGSEISPDTLSLDTREGLDRGRQLAQQLLAQVKGRGTAASQRFQRLRGWLPSRTQPRPPAP